MRYPVILLALLVGLTGCQPTPASLRVFALDWITAYQVQQGDVQAARETAALARVTDDFATELEFEYGQDTSTASRMAAAAALAWAGDNSGAEHAATQNITSRFEELKTLAAVALAHARAGHGPEARRMADLAVETAEGLRSEAAPAIAALAALALAWSGDMAAARELAAKSGAEGISLIALALAQAGDFKSAVAAASSIPQDRRGDEGAVGGPVAAATVPTTSIILVFPDFVGGESSSADRPLDAVRTRTLMRIAWLQAIAGDPEGAIASAGLIAEPALRAEALGLVGLELAAAGKKLAADRAIGLARQPVSESAAGPDAAYLAALLQAAAGDVPGALEAAKRLDKKKGTLLWQIAIAQARSGDLAAARRTADRADDPWSRAALPSLLAMLAGETSSSQAGRSLPPSDAPLPVTDPKMRWMNWLLSTMQATLSAARGDMTAAIETATGIAGRETRNAALRAVAVAQAAASDTDAARHTIEEIQTDDKGIRHRIADDALSALGETGSVEMAVLAAHQPGLFAGDIRGLADIALARARAGDAHGARLAADAAETLVKPEDQFAIIWAAYAQAAAGDMKAAIELLKRGRFPPHQHAADPVPARIAAGGDGVVVDIAALADYADGAFQNAADRVSALCGYAVKMAELGAADRARAVALRAQEAAKLAIDLRPSKLACLAKALALSGEKEAAQAVLDSAVAATERDDVELRFYDREGLAGALAALGRQQDALEMAEGIAEPQGRSSAFEQIALAQATLGRLDEAFRSADWIGDIERRAWALGEIASRRAIADAVGARHAGARAADAAGGLLDAEARAYRLREVVRTQIEIRDAEGARRTAAMALEGAAGVRLPALRALCLGEAAEALAAAGAAAEARRAVDLGREAALAIHSGFYRALALSQLARAQAAAGDSAAARGLADLAHEAALSIAE